LAREINPGPESSGISSAGIRRMAIVMLVREAGSLPLATL
jgi:hypothetical protein